MLSVERIEYCVQTRPTQYAQRNTHNAWKMNELEQYLQSKYRPQTVKAYLYDIHNYHAWMGEEQAQCAQYDHILIYIKYLRERKAIAPSPQVIQKTVCALKAYYTFLVEQDERKRHPCLDLKLIDNRTKEVQIQDLFTVQELQNLLQRGERYSLLKRRNALIMSLLVHQALTAAEIVNLTLEDLDLDQATLNIRQNTQTEGRILDLKATQISLFYAYLNEDRPKLMTLKTPFLILTKRGTVENTEGVQYLVSTFRPFFKRKITPTTIRQSVIVNRLKAGEDLRHVQLFAGHRSISSTERYKTSGLDELKAVIMTNHPLEKRFNKA
jgi:site-specific recombinase XerD